MVARLSQYPSARKDVSSLQRHTLISLSIHDIHTADESGFSKSQPAACWQSISALRAFPDAVGLPAAVLADRSCAVDPDPPRSIPLWQDLPAPKKAPAINVVLKDGLPSVTSAHGVLERPAIFQTDFARHLFIGPEFQDASMQGTDLFFKIPRAAPVRLGGHCCQSAFRAEDANPQLRRGG